MILVQPTEISVGVHSLRYAFSREVNDVLKLVPGVRWDMAAKRWLAPTHALPALYTLLTERGVAKLAPPQWLPRSAPVYGGPTQALRPYQRDGLDRALVYGSFLLAMQMRTGKGHHLDEEIPLATGGFRRAGDVQVGDMLCGRVGPTKVVGVFPRGVLPFCRVTFTDGTALDVSEDHLWEVITPDDVFKGRPARVFETRHFETVALHSSGYYRWRIPVEAAERMQTQPLPCPYTLGVMIGDGGRDWTPRSCQFTPGDENVPREVAAETGLALKAKKGNGRATTYKLQLPILFARLGGPALYAEVLEAVAVRGHLRKIPRPYLENSSVETRWALLQGLLDTDGHFGKKGSTDFSTTSPRLAEQVVELVQSLGGVAKSTQRQTYYTYLGAYKTGRISWRVSISFPPHRVPSRAHLHRILRRTVNHATRAIKSVERIDARECVCFKVAAEDGLYHASRQYILTHNTPVALSWIASHTEPSALVIYPSMATDEWQRQWTKFEMPFPLAPIEGVNGLAQDFVAATAGFPRLAFGISYELLRVEKGKPSQTILDLQALLASRGPYNCVADEIQMVADRKAPRTKLFVDLGRGAAHRLALTGTPMRNRPANLYLPLDWLWPGQWGSWSKFSARYAGGQMGEYGWVAKDVTNPEELQARLAVCSLRISRADVAPWLPKTERRVFSVKMSSDTQKRYNAAEAAVVGEIEAALKGAGANAALEKLALITVPEKFELLAQRLQVHDGKMVVGALHHDVLLAAWNFLQEKFKGSAESVPWLFIAPGWSTRAQREAGIAAWKAAVQLPGHPHPTLLVNTLSSGVAIDLSDAITTIGIEACWVPSDFLQFESRIHTVVPKPSKPPPLHEYLLARGTVDEDMTTRLLSKLEATAKVVGADAETLGAHEALAASGVTDRGVVGLMSHDDDTVFSVIARMRARVSGEAVPSISSTTDNNDTQSAYDALDNEDESEDE